MNLYEQTKKLWNDDARRKSRRWADKILRGLPHAEQAAKKFHQWPPLPVYVSEDKMRKSKTTFSVRFAGQEVAELEVGCDPMLIVTAKKAQDNLRYFKAQTQEMTCGWRTAEAKDFRRTFRNPATPGQFGLIKERAVESYLLQQMKKRRREEKGLLAGIRPVCLGRFPLQWPVPVSACHGRPEAKPGHIDILARQLDGRRVRLAVWELKSPGVLNHALEQAYIYTVALALTLRGKDGQNWYHLFGYRRDLPKRLPLASVVAVSMDQKGAIEEAAKDFLSENPLELEEENASIKMFAAYYNPKSWKVESPLQLLA